MNAPTNRSPKFKYTRELVQIAIGDGMTQEEIARLCRTQQSVVSAWFQGRSKARAEVLRPLVERYGHRLNKTTARMYLVPGEPSPPFEDSRDGRLLLRILEDPEAYAREHLSEEELTAFVQKHDPGSTPPARPADGRYYLGSWKGWFAARPVREALQPVLGADHRIDLDELRTEYAQRFERVVRVEGPVIWRHTSGTAKVVLRREGRHGERRELGMEPKERWLLHGGGTDSLRFVRQTLRRLHGSARNRWRDEAHRLARVPSSEGPLEEAIQHPFDVISDDEAARWISTISQPMSVAEILAHVEGLLASAGPHDRAVVPFTLRKGLVEHGYSVPDVGFLPAL